jgi:hypothetical protein
MGVVLDGLSGSQEEGEADECLSRCEHETFSYLIVILYNNVFFFQSLLLCSLCWVVV